MGKERKRKNENIGSTESGRRREKDSAEVVGEGYIQRQGGEAMLGRDGTSNLQRA